MVDSKEIGVNHLTVAGVVKGGKQSLPASHRILRLKEEDSGGMTEVEFVDSIWMADGKCRDLPPETFFPSDGVGVEIARRICADCPVKGPCLEYALHNRIEHGVWGGASERERRRIARQRRGLQKAVAD
jgi:WhiB family redox-sensing transcriptional regulator